MSLDVYKLEKPDLEGVNRNRVFGLLDGKFLEIMAVIEKTMSPVYLYWDKVKYRVMPEGVTKKEFWYLTKFIRKSRSVPTFINDEHGEKFSWVKLDRFDRFLHRVDMEAGGNLFIPGDRLSTLGSHKEHYIARGILEEAIASSQLEGAHTTRKAAKKMILEKRKPRTKDEQMILNNYLVMQKIQEDYKDAKLTRDLVLEIHRMLTEKTDVDEEEVGRFRTDDDDVVVGDDEKIGHIPPKEEVMHKELDRLLAIANDEEDEPRFLHPIIKAILLHFWIGYLHPFADGNGRFARAIFYWYLLKHDYWAMMYLPISVMIKKSPIQYSFAYIYSEQDNLDVTYFVDYHLRKIEQAIEDFQKYLKKKYLENRRVTEKLASDTNINDRQKFLLIYLAKHPDERITIGSHEMHNDIHKLTARKDLYELVEWGFLKLNKSKGHFVFFTPTKKTSALSR